MSWRRGCTLVEAVAVVAVIAIVFAVVAPLATRQVPADYYFTRQGLVRSVSYSPNGAGSATFLVSVFSNQRDWSFTGPVSVPSRSFQIPFLPGDTVQLTYLKKDMTDPVVVQVDPQ